jgi:HAD superfamily hydrolase (TIGR01509 family)
VIEAVLFDLDGVLIDSEDRWDAARREVAQHHGGQWQDGATEAMQGMSSPEWAAYLHDQLKVDAPREQITREVVDRLLAGYEHDVPLLPGAMAAVQRLAARWPLGLASSANRPVIDMVLDRSGLGPYFAVTVSSEEVPRGKPAPDVYLDAASWLDIQPPACAVIEDSANGIRAGAAAGMRVVAIPNHRFSPPDDVLALADVILPGLAELTPESVL